MTPDHVSEATGRLADIQDLINVIQGLAQPVADEGATAVGARSAATAIVGMANAISITLERLAELVTDEADLEGGQ